MRLCRELARFIGEPFVQCYTDTVSYTRPDSLEALKKKGKARFVGYATGAFFILDDVIRSGDVVVPLELVEEKIRELERFGCPPQYIHRHEEFGTGHIHIGNCVIRGRHRQFARIVGE